MTVPIAPRRIVRVNELEPTADRVNELADLLKALATATEQRSLQQGALNVAARHLCDTAERLCAVLDQHR